MTIYPLVDDGAAAITATGDIAPSGTATKAGAATCYYQQRFDRKHLQSNVGDTVADVVTAATAADQCECLTCLLLPVDATPGTSTDDRHYAPKWEGPTGNDIVHCEVEGGEDTGDHLCVATQPTGGLQLTLTLDGGISPDRQCVGNDGPQLS